MGFEKRFCQNKRCKKFENRGDTQQFYDAVFSLQQTQRQHGVV